MAGENPRATFVVSIAITTAMKSLIFDPYRQCNLAFTIISILWTALLCVGLPVGAMLINWSGLFNAITSGIVSLSAAAGAVMTAYAVYKKTFRTRRRKRVTKARKDIHDKSREMEGY